MGDGRDRFLGRADVGGNLDAMPVGRRRRLARRRPLTVALRGEAPHHGPRRGNLGLVGVLEQSAARAVEQNRGAVLELERRAIDAADGG